MATGDIADIVENIRNEGDSELESQKLPFKSLPTLSAVLENVATLADNNPLIHNLITSKDSSLFKRISTLGAECFDKSLGVHRTQYKIVVYENLTSEELKFIQNAYPAYTFDIVYGSNNNHGLLALSRRIELQELLRCTVDCRRDVPLIDVGGLFTTHIKNGYTEIHSDCPRLDNRDNARWTERINNLALVSDRQTVIAAYRDIHRVYISTTPASCRFVCNKRFQDCDFKAKHAIAVHALYDITIDEFSEGMLKRGVEICRATMMWDPRMLRDDTGINSTYNYKWIVDKSTNRIEMFVEGDSSFSYVHDYNNYLQWFTVNQHVVKSNPDYVMIIECREWMSGIQYLAVTLTVNCPSMNNITHRVHFPDRKDMIGVRVFSVRTPGFKITDKYSPKLADMMHGHERLIKSESQLFARTYPISSKIFYVPRKLVDKVMKFVWGSTESKFVPHEIFKVFRSVCSTFITNKVLTAQYESIPHEEMYQISLTLYMYAYEMKYRNGKALQFCLNQLEHNRTMIFGGILKKLSVTKNDTMDCRNTILTSIHDLVTRIRSSQVRVEDMLFDPVTSVSFSSTITLRFSANNSYEIPANEIHDSNVRELLELFDVPCLRIGLDFSEVKLKYDFVSNKLVLLKNLQHRIDGITKREYDRRLNFLRHRDGLNDDNNSQTKFRNILKICYPGEKNFSGKRALELSAAPGGIVKLLYRSGFCVDYFVFNNGVIKPYDDLPGNCLNKVNYDMDLTSAKATSENAKQLVFGYDLVVGDACLYTEYKERDNFVLLSNEMELSLKSLNIGGVVVLKVFYLFCHKSVEKIIKFAENFEHLYVHREENSPYLSGELYLCFVNYGKRRVENRDTIYSLIHLARVDLVDELIDRSLNVLSIDNVIMYNSVELNNFNIRLFRFRCEFSDDDRVVMCNDSVRTSLGGVDLLEMCEINKLIRMAGLSYLQGMMDLYSEIKKFFPILYKYVFYELLCKYSFCFNYKNLSDFADSMRNYLISAGAKDYLDTLVLFCVSVRSTLFSRLFKSKACYLYLLSCKNFYFPDIMLKIISCNLDSIQSAYFSGRSIDSERDITVLPPEFYSVDDILLEDIRVTAYADYSDVGEDTTSEEDNGFTSDSCVLSSEDDSVRDRSDDDDVRPRVESDVVVHRDDDFDTGTSNGIGVFERFRSPEPTGRFLSECISGSGIVYDIENSSNEFAEYFVQVGNVFDTDHLTIRSAPADGNCLFWSVSNLHEGQTFRERIVSLGCDVFEVVSGQYCGVETLLWLSKTFDLWFVIIESDDKSVVRHPDVFIPASVLYLSAGDSHFNAAVFPCEYCGSTDYVIYFSRNYQNLVLEYLQCENRLKIVNNYNFNHCKCTADTNVVTFMDGINSFAIPTTVEFSSKALEHFRLCNYSVSMLRLCYGIVYEFRPLAVDIVESKPKRIKNISYNGQVTNSVFTIVSDVYRGTSVQKMTSGQKYLVRTSTSDGKINGQIVFDSIKKYLPDEGSVLVKSTKVHDMFDLVQKINRVGLEVVLDLNYDYSSDFQFTPYEFRSMDLFSYSQAAVNELVDTWKSARGLFLTDMRKLLVSISNGDLNISSASEYYRPDVGIYSVVVESERVINCRIEKRPNDDGPHQVFYYNSGTSEGIHVNRNKAFIDVGTKLDLPDNVYTIIVSKKTKVFLDDKLLKISTNYKNFPTRFALRVEEGCPGVGKTYFVIENHIPFSDVILTATRGAAEDLRRRVKLRYPELSESVLKQRYCTLTSFLFNPINDVKTLYIDEGFMDHFGKLVLAGRKSNCDSMVLIGDSAQIPYFDSYGCRISYSHYKGVTDASTNYRTVSRRCPADVIYILNEILTNKDGERMYKKRLTTTNSKIDTVKAFIELDIGKIPRRDCQYLVYTQSEKYDLSKHFPDICTIAEFQGKQHSNVILIRTNDKDIIPFDDPSQMLVALSRHTESFEYYTCVSDMIVQMIYNLRHTSKADVKACVVRGGIPVNYDVVVKPGFVTNSLFERKTFRDFVYQNGFSGVVNADLILDPLPYITTPDDEVNVENYSKLSDAFVLNALQFFIDEIRPGSTLTWDTNTNNKYIAEIFEFFGELTGKPDISIKDKYVFPKYRDSLTAALRTPCPRKSVPSVKTLTKAFMERNGDVPQLAGEFDSIHFASKIFYTVVPHLYDENYLKFCKENPIEISSDLLERWKYSAKQGTMEHIEDWFNVHEIPFRDKYMMSLKLIPKPALDKLGYLKFPSPQVIAAQEKYMNIFFCSIGKLIKERDTACMKRNHIINSDMAPDDFVELLNLRCPPSFQENYLPYMLEIDMSKYDKSQGHLALMLDILFLLEFGFPPDIIVTYIICHCVNALSSIPFGFSAYLHYQRKSGEFLTLLGNTKYSQFSVLYSILNHHPEYDMTKLFGMWAGDDSLLFLGNDVARDDICRYLATIFNLEAKIFRFKTPYFCSKFLFRNCENTSWCFVPDVWKLLIKLGRCDLVDFTHVQEYRISLVDITKVFSNVLIYSRVSEAMKDRYDVDFDCETLCMCLYYFPRKENLFLSSFYVDDGDELTSYNGTRPNLDI